VIKLDSYEQYLLDAGKAILNDAKDPLKSGEELSKPVSDRKLKAQVNRLLLEDSSESIESINRLDVAIASLALKNRLKCRACDPEKCEGFLMRLYVQKDGHVGYEWRVCELSYKRKYLIPKIVDMGGDEERLEKLSVSQLRSIIGGE
jgi:hypothetical protein